MSGDVVDSLIQWFTRNGGVFDSECVGFRYDEESGRGAFALCDIRQGQVLFTIPRHLLLSTRTCALREQLGENAWKRLGAGWAGLILCMMWEQAKGSDGKWSPYFDILPKSFSTPMFWAAEELEALRGTTILEKIGKEDAEEEYRSRIVSVIKTRPDLFPPSTLQSFYTLEKFHHLGSSILSRSFHVEVWQGETSGKDDRASEDEEGDDDADESFDGASGGKTSGVVPDEDAMDIDTMRENHNGEDEENDDQDEDDDDDAREDTSDVSMVPMADMLNARYGSDNARLFYEENSVLMISTKYIKAGEQIWNTYGDPPNSDLLRRYGHVDSVPLPDGSFGNPADVVEVKASLAVEVVASTSKQDIAERIDERIDWWLEQGGDDVFVIEASKLSLPAELISLLRLLLMPEPEWTKTKTKEKPPKPSLDAEVIPVAIKMLLMRLEMYETTVEADTQLLSNTSSLSRNLRNAIVVRAGEKQVLNSTLDNLRILFARTKGEEAGAGKKRRGDSDGDGRKRSRK